jgi:pimeloyl-ACP methyl ester carboxylesterase
MPRRNPLYLKTLLPLFLLVFLILTGVTVWLIHTVANPPHQSYIVTPEKYVNLSVRGVQVSDEKWSNRDGTKAQGWLLRGAKGAPAVVFLHGYGTDRSWSLNLGVKLNETTNFTILWPDLRGHGEKPATTGTSFGPKEIQDLDSALEFLKNLKTPDNQPLVGESVGMYGVEMGAYTALAAAQSHPIVRALTLDSVPLSADDVIGTAVGKYTGMDNAVLRFFVKVGARVYYLGRFHSESTCDLAKPLGNAKVLLLAGKTSGRFLSSTQQLAACFSTPPNVQVKTDLPLTGSDTVSATGEQSEAYDRLVIDFFDKSLRASTTPPGQSPAKK